MKFSLRKRLSILFGCGLVALMVLGVIAFLKYDYSFIALLLFSVFTFCYTFLYAIKHTEKVSESLNLDSTANKRTSSDIETDRIYRTLAANIPGSAITILDREGRYLLAEGDMLVSMGYTKADMPGRKIAEVIAPENYLWYQPLIHQAFNGETLLKERRTLSGLDALIRVVPLKDESDYIYAIMFVLIDVTEVKKAQSELALLNKTLESKIAERTVQLKELNKGLEAFSYSISHDLRAPLRAILGFAQMIKEDYTYKLEEEGQLLLDRIVHNGIRMEKLIDDLLEFSRLGRVELPRSQINMHALVDEVKQELVGQERSRKINITTSPLENAQGDPNMIRQVWINLISNALKYTNKKEVTEIEIACKPESEMICYYIRDNGAGFDMAFSDKLFGVFQRLHAAKEFEGTGVGLSLVHTIVSRHGGKVWADAKLNEGAAFYFTLPS